MSLFTEKNYIQWVKQFINFHSGIHPREMGPKEITEFLSHLAIDKNVSASTQNQAPNALVAKYEVAPKHTETKCKLSYLKRLSDGAFHLKLNKPIPLNCVLKRKNLNDRLHKTTNNHRVRLIFRDSSTHKIESLFFRDF